jgi:hypothetical protein
MKTGIRDLKMLIYFPMTMGLLLSGCKQQIKPAIAIAQVPTASMGGPSQMEPISGSVSNAKAGDQVILYARSGVWWLQPLTDQPYTKVQADSTWKNLTHLGSEYAALLVEPGYKPASKTITLPAEGNGVLAVAVMKGNATAAYTPPGLQFSGYDWTVQTGMSDHGGQPYAYDSANAWTDNKGYLHLRMNYRNGRWACSEVSLQKSLGYGTYKFVVQDAAHLRPSAVLGMFTWDDAHSTNFRNELDVELSRWGKADNPNAQFVVQPFFGPDNLTRFSIPAGITTYLVRWEPGKASFSAFGGEATSPTKPIYEHVFQSGVPTPANEKVHVDLYDFHHSEALSGQPEEAIIESFAFVPEPKTN